MGLNTFGSPRHLSSPWIQWNVQSKRNWCTNFRTKWSKPRANWMLENKILRLFREPIKCLRMLQLYQKEVSKLYTIKELKGVAKMRSKMCSQRLQNSTKTNSPKAGKCTILRAKEALVAFVYDHIQAPKCVKVSFAAPHYYSIQKEQPNLQKSERKKQNKLWQAN